MQTVVTGGTLAEITVQKWETDSAVVTRIFVARTRQTVVNVRVVLSDVYREILIRFTVHHQSLHGAHQSGPGSGQTMNFSPVSKKDQVIVKISRKIFFDKKFIYSK